MGTFTSPFIEHRGYTFSSDCICWMEDGVRKTTRGEGDERHVIIKGKRVYFKDIENLVNGGHYEA